MSVLPESKTRGLKQMGAGHLWWALSVFLIGLAAKLQLIQKFGLPLPYLDEWPAEAIGVFIPWFTHQFSAATLFVPRNEHHIVFTHLCELCLLLANGHWDAQLEMVVNAFIHTLFAIWILACAGGLFHLTERAWSEYIPSAASDQKQQLENARAFLASNDEHVLLNKPGEQLIVGNANAVVWLLRNPVVRQILPACARDAIKDEPGKPGEDGPLSSWAAKNCRGMEIYFVRGAPLPCDEFRCQQHRKRTSAEGLRIDYIKGSNRGTPDGSK